MFYSDVPTSRRPGVPPSRRPAVLGPRRRCPARDGPPGPNRVVIERLFEAETGALLAKVRAISETWTGQLLDWPQPYEARGWRHEISGKQRLPAHHHPQPRLGQLVAGPSQVVNLAGRQELPMSPEERIAESVLQTHFGEAVGSENVVLHVLDIVPPGV